MIIKRYDTVIIGGGAAGMSAAIAIYDKGYKPLIIDRESFLGGILMQCIHNGFGLHHFKEELTGPEYAERLADSVTERGIDCLLDATVISISSQDKKNVTALSPSGVHRIDAETVILATGCRERNRGNIGISGSRPAGIFTAGLAQRLMNINGYIQGRRVVIIGSGDIGLIMARRLTWSGCTVCAVIEIMPYPSGISRNITQCIDDFSIPLYLSHSITEIKGKNRVSSVVVTPLVNGAPKNTESFEIECDTVLISAGLIPENELAQNAGIPLSRSTGGPTVDAFSMTEIPGIFSCGNALHVHDLVDFVSEESIRCGESAVSFMKDKTSLLRQYPVICGSNLKYVSPSRYTAEYDNTFYMRPLILKRNARVILSISGKPVKEIKFERVQPSEMITCKVRPDDLPALNVLQHKNEMEISLI